MTHAVKTHNKPCPSAFDLPWLYRSWWSYSWRGSSQWNYRAVDIETREYNQKLTFNQSQLTYRTKLTILNMIKHPQVFFFVMRIKVQEEQINKILFESLINLYIELMLCYINSNTILPQLINIKHHTFFSRSESMP